MSAVVGGLAPDPEYTPLKVAKVRGDAPVRWLSKGWQDFKARPFLAIGYGLFFVLVCWCGIVLLFFTGLEWMLGPAIAGAMLLGPVIATGLYKESRRLEETRSGQTDAEHHRLNLTQVALVGTILMALMLIWVRAAVIIYALFFGLVPFPGIQETFTTLFFTPPGLLMLGVGSAVGGLFAALVFAISAFSIPRLVDQNVDAFTAMGSSFVAVTRNFWPMVKWGVIITILSLLGFATLLLGMIIVFPVLGFATWHSYDEVFHPERGKG